MSHKIIGITIMLLFVIGLAACGLPDSLSEGDAAPDFSLVSAGGETVSLDDYSGQPVLLYFHMAMG